MSLSKTAAVTTLAGLALTLAMSWPVVVAPSSRIFGHEIDGRHHDPFTVMRQFDQGPPPFPYRQPLVDDLGAAIARATGPVPAFNAIVLVTFPLSVLAAFLLARYIGLSNTGASIAAFAFAFAPLHVAHAAYHPHTAQTQWIPLYLLALLAALDRMSLLRLALLSAAAAALALGNLYGAFICAVITPVVVVAKKWGQTPFSSWGLSPLFFGALAFPATDLARYGAQWLAYALPPADHPLWGAAAREIWNARGMTGALVEQQVSLSWALVALAGYAIWQRRTRTVWTLALLALVSAWISLAPPGGHHPWWIPSSSIYPLLPMFRAYARFAFVTHLMIALLAGIGAGLLLERDAAGQRRRRTAAAALLLVAAVEYAPLPARARDVLPTAAHRWLADKAAPGLVLDCVPGSMADTHLAWLMRREISPLPAALPSCDEQQAASRAATLGYRYAIVRGTRESPDTLEPPPGFILVRDFSTSAVYDIVAPPAPAIVARIEGFYRIERRGSEAWRWMDGRGRWLLQVPVETAATLEVEVSAYQHSRQLVVSLNGRQVTVLRAGVERSWHRIGPLRLTPGQHELVFDALGEPFPSPPPDRRRLDVRLHDWRWR